MEISLSSKLNNDHEHKPTTSVNSQENLAALEAEFFRIILETSGINRGGNSFLPGIGESQFSSLLSGELANAASHFAPLGISAGISNIIKPEDPK